ncbi:hypothetical protein [Haliangium ochraceum]
MKPQLLFAKTEPLCTSCHLNE